MINVLISNDDGIHAPGIQTLFNTLNSSCNSFMVAPQQERSTTGHSLNLDSPLRLEQIHEKQWACSGFPADCVLMGLGHVMRENRPNLVVSGINRDANLGQDIFYSGTLAAAREACFHGVPSIGVSLSLDKKKNVLHYETAALFIRELIKLKVHEFIPELVYLNVNVPNLAHSEVKGIKITKVGFKHYSEDIEARIDSRGRPYYWITGTYQGFRSHEQTDCQAIDDGFISVTALQVSDLGPNVPHELYDLILSSNFPKCLL
jgi:5'-nucleotidase